MDATWSAILIAVIGSSAVTAVVTSWLNGRRDTASEMRERRLEAYPTVWARTSDFSTWPRTTADAATLEQLHRDLRRWYYADGGLYLSENARERYGELQQLIGRVLALGQPVDGSTYRDLMEQASAFRTALTEDLESRAQRSLVSWVGLSSRHRRQERAAQARLGHYPAVPAPAARVGTEPIVPVGHSRDESASPS